MVVADKDGIPIGNNAKCQDEKHNFDILDKTILASFGLYFILKPFYFWRSGLPQVADIVMVLTMITYFIKHKFKVNITSREFRVTKTVLAFVCWVILVNLVWAIRLQTFGEFLLSSAWYVYNFSVFLLSVQLMYKYKKRLLRIILNSILISVVIQMFVFVAAGGFSVYRNTTTFNNPNQLAYFALLITSFLFFTDQELRIKTLPFVIILVSALLLQVASLSATGIVANIGLLLWQFFTKSLNKKQQIRRSSDSFMTTSNKGEINCSGRVFFRL